MEKKTRKQSKYKSEIRKKISALIVKGFTNKEISLEIGLYESSVNNHIISMLAEFNCANRTQLAVKIATGK